MTSQNVWTVSVFEKGVDSLFGPTIRIRIRIKAKPYFFTIKQLNDKIAVSKLSCFMLGTSLMNNEGEIWQRKMRMRDKYYREGWEWGEKYDREKWEWGTSMTEGWEWGTGMTEKEENEGQVWQRKMIMRDKYDREGWEWGTSMTEKDENEGQVWQRRMRVRDKYDREGWEWGRLTNEQESYRFSYWINLDWVMTSWSVPLFSRGWSSESVWSRDGLDRRRMSGLSARNLKNQIRYMRASWETSCGSFWNFIKCGCTFF